MRVLSWSTLRGVGWVALLSIAFACGRGGFSIETEPSASLESSDEPEVPDTSTGGGASDDDVGDDDTAPIALTFASSEVIGGSGGTRSFSFAMESSGIQAISGKWNGSLSIGADMFTATTDDSYLVVYDALDTLRYGRVFGSDAADGSNGTAVSADGRVALAGEFRSTLNIDALDVTSLGDMDFYIARFSPTGEVEFLVRAGSSALDIGHTVAFAPDGGVVVFGEVRGPSRAGSLDGIGFAGGVDMLLVSVDPAGEVRWAQSFGGAGQDGARGLAVAPDGTIYAAGWFEGTVDFGDGERLAVGGKDAVVLALNPNGELLWSRVYGGAGDAEFAGAAVDALGNGYFVGTYTGELSVDAAPLPTGGGGEALILSVDRMGATRWVTTGVGADLNVAHGVAVRDEQLYVTGYFSGSLSLGDSLTAEEAQDGFVFRSDAATGAIDWQSQIPGAISLGVGVGEGGRVAVGGYFRERIRLGPSEFNAQDGSESFILRFQP